MNSGLGSVTPGCDEASQVCHSEGFLQGWGQAGACTGSVPLALCQGHVTHVTSSGHSDLVLVAFVISCPRVILNEPPGSG